MDWPPRSPPPAAPDQQPRVFFALVPDSDMRTRLAPLARQFAQRMRGRATAPESLHLTLAFVGIVSPERVDDLVAIGASAPHDGIDLTLDTVGVFRRARVAWIAPAATPRALAALQGALALAVTAQGFVFDERPFRPHVTLARKCVTALVAEAIAPIAWRIQRLALMASTLDPAGARYRELAGWPLRAPDPV